ncbi:MAG: hypothetical protein HQ592_07855 [Planctomycetes bacterium]|jgi:hypothetical protein|nr:hypothetical protein [Planctomycetota bacterium]
MTNGKLTMIRDVLSWTMPPERKLAHISQIVEERPAGMMPPQAAKPKGPAKRAGSRAELWSELKRVAPRRAAQIGYTRATGAKIQRILAQVKKGK